MSDSFDSKVTAPGEPVDTIPRGNAQEEKLSWIGATLVFAIVILGCVATALKASGVWD